MARKRQRFHSSNVVLDAAGESRLWSFQGPDLRPAGSTAQPADWPLPPKLVRKGWAELARPRLNIAWLGEQPVFLQLVHLPTDDPAEVPAMLELQLEKLSPLPVGQVVWTYEILPQRPAAGLPVLLLLAERAVLENALAALEKRGFRADRVETPILPLITGTAFAQDGAYIFVHRSGSRQTCLIGWVAEGALRALNVVNLSEDTRWSRQFLDELNRLSWVGEIEGWVAGGPPSLHLVADEPTLADWRAPLEEALGRPVTPHTRPPDADLAAASARRAAASPLPANLLPAEFAARYRQEFTDRLWMGGLAAVFVAYLVGVLIYLGAVEVQRFRRDRIAGTLGEVNAQFTNTLRVKAQAQVLQETVNLRFAALESWMATVETMPEELSLESFAFSGGRSVVISGYVPADQQARITEFWTALQKKVVGNTNLFAKVDLKPTSQRVVGGVPQILWGFDCTLRRPDL